MSAAKGIRRGKWLLTALAAVAGIIIFSGGTATTGAGDGAAAADRPDIITILADDLDVMSMEALLEAGLMPNLQEHVIDQGATFSESFVTDSMCCPSRATFLTGKYPHNHGVYSLKFPSGGGGLLWLDLHGDGELDGDFEGEDEMAQVWLQRSGYNTGFVGKYLNGNGKVRPKEYVPPGWDDWQSLIAPTTYCMYNYEIYDSRAGEAVTYAEDGTIATRRNGEVVGTRQAASWQDNYQTDVLASRSVDFVREASQESQPFFMHVNPLAPHIEGCTAPDKWAEDPDGVWGLSIRPAERHGDLGEIPALPEEDMLSLNEPDLTDKPQWMWDPESPKYRAPLDEEDLANLRVQHQQRLASMRAVDDMIGDIVEELKAQGRWDNTVLMFTSDNGWLSGHHRLSQKIFAYEESIRVPLYVRVPGATGPQTREQMVINNDIAPTLADLAGAEIPSDFTVDGRSFAPLLEDGGEPSWGRKRFMVANYVVRDRLMMLPTFHAIRGPNSLYVHWQDAYGSREFYPRLDEPRGAAQLKNFYPSLGEDSRSGLARLTYRFKGCAGDYCRALEDF